MPRGRGEEHRMTIGRTFALLAVGGVCWLLWQLLLTVAEDTDEERIPVSRPTRSTWPRGH
jgi:hypothetical protein